MGKEEDFGRFRETKLALDKFAFRTPSLLNVEMTGPWGHSGAYTSLEAVVRHHMKPQNSVTNYDVGQLRQVGLQHLDKVQTNTQKALDHSNFSLRDQSLAMYDKGDSQGTELRAFAGNFLFSTGSNQYAKRFTAAHFDLPMRDCTISLDEQVIVEGGVLQGELA